jgi:hypothetical protein
VYAILCSHVRGYIQKFPDWLPGTRTANGLKLGRGTGHPDVGFFLFFSFPAHESYES